MKLARILLKIGGAVNALFFLFHLWLGWNIWHWTQVPVGLRSLLEIFNVGGTLFIGFFAYASLCHTTEMLQSRLGRSLSVLVVLLFGTRAASEFIFSARAQPGIVATCLVAALLYVGVLWLQQARTIAVSSAPAQPVA